MSLFHRHKWRTLGITRITGPNGGFYVVTQSCVYCAMSRDQGNYAKDHAKKVAADFMEKEKKQNG